MVSWSRIKCDFDYDDHDEILVRSPWGIGILRVSYNSPALEPLMMAANGTNFGGWILDTATQNFNLVGAFYAGFDQILVRSPEGIAILKLSGNTLEPLMMAANGTKFGGWVLNTANDQFGPVGAFEGAQLDEVFVKSPWGIGILKVSENTLKPVMMVANGTKFGGWKLNTADQHFGPVGHFNGDLMSDEILVRSPEGIAILKLSGNTLEPLMMAANGTNFGGWVLNTANDQFGPIGRFNGERDQIFVRSPWGIGILELSGYTLKPVMMASNGTNFGGWVLNTANDQFGPVGFFYSDPKKNHDSVLFKSPWGIAVLELSENTLKPVMMAANGTRFEGYLVNTADQRFSPVGRAGSENEEIFVTSPWGIGILKVSKDTHTLKPLVMAANGTQFGGYILNTKKDVFGVNSRYIMCVYIIFEGDSLTAAGIYPDYVKYMLNLDGINVAFGGDKLSGMIEQAGQVDTEFRPNCQNIVVLWAGTNDLSGGITPEELHKLIQKWCKGRKDKGFQVIVCTITPRGNWCGPLSVFEERRLVVNEMIRMHYSEYADGLADIAANHDIGDEGDQNDKRYYSDTVHMTSDGYKIVANIVKDSIIAIDPTIGSKSHPV